MSNQFMGAEWDYLRNRPFRPRKPHIWKQGGLWRCGWARGGRQAMAHSPVAAFHYFTECMQ